MCTAGAGPKASQPAVVFSGQSLSTPSALISGSNFTLVAVVKVPSTTAAQGILNPGGGSGGFLLGVSNNTTGDRDFNANGVSAITDGTMTTGWEAWVFSSDSSGNLTLTVNNVAKTLSPATATGTGFAAKTYIGGLNGSTRLLTGSLWEILVYSTKLGTTDTASLMTYLSASTGLF